MNIRKVVASTTKSKCLALDDYDHYISLDWSEKIMAIGHMGKRCTEPVVFERPASMKDLKQYIRSLRGSIVLTFEETTTAQWLYG
jgi:hypothetical protein